MCLLGNERMSSHQNIKTLPWAIFVSHRSKKTIHKPSEPILLAKLSVRFVSDGKLSSNHPNMFITIIISIRKNSGDKQQQANCV